MKSARTTDVNASFSQFGWQSLQPHTLLLDRWCGPLLLKPSCWYTACSEAATATDFSMPPSQMHIARTVAWPDAQSRNAALRHCFIRHGKSRPSMQARMASVCSPKCVCCRWSNAIPSTPPLCGRTYWATAARATSGYRNSACAGIRSSSPFEFGCEV